jgi:hypothetical protein
MRIRCLNSTRKIRGIHYNKSDKPLPGLLKNAGSTVSPGAGGTEPVGRPKVPGGGEKKFAVRRIGLDSGFRLVYNTASIGE